MSEDKTSGSKNGNEDTAPVEQAAGGATDPPALSHTGRGSWVGWLALLLSALALAAAGLDYLRDRDARSETESNDTRLRTITDSVAATRETVATLDQSLTALTAHDADRAKAIENIGRRLEDRLRQVQSLPARVTAVEASLSSLQGISSGARDAWLLAEAEYFMQIANAQSQLANNPELAKLALTQADERILQLADPRLTEVRQALSNELRALEVMEKPDITSLTLKLASLAAVVDSLPLAQEESAADDTGEEAIDSALTGMDRAWVSVKNAINGVVSVRDAEEHAQPLVAPEARYFLRTNLALQLQAARVALLRGEETVFRQSLDDADAWIEKYYATDSKAVQGARATIATMHDSVLHVKMPDISRSLRLLRQFNSLAKTAGEPATDEETDPGQKQ